MKNENDNETQIRDLSLDERDGEAVKGGRRSSTQAPSPPTKTKTPQPKPVQPADMTSTAA